MKSNIRDERIAKNTPVVSPYMPEPLTLITAALLVKSVDRTKKCPSKWVGVARAKIEVCILGCHETSIAIQIWVTLYYTRLDFFAVILPIDHQVNVSVVW